MTTKALPYISLLAVLFGTTLLASRFSVGQYHPSTYIGLRMMIAGSAHILIYTFTSRKWPRGKNLWRRSMLLGSVGTAVPMTAIVTSLQYQSSGITSLLLTTGPAFTVLLAHFMLPDEKLTLRKSIGILLALAGASLLALKGESGLPDVAQANPLGYALVLIAMVVASITTIYTRKYMNDYDTFDVASIRMWAAAATVMPLSLLFVGFDISNVTLAGYGALAYAALVGTFSGMMLAFYNIQRFGATASALVSNLIPIVAGIGGVFLLGEQFTQTMLIGMVMILLGIGIINQRNKSN